MEPYDEFRNRLINEAIVRRVKEMELDIVMGEIEDAHVRLDDAGVPDFLDFFYHKRQTTRAQEAYRLTMRIVYLIKRRSE